jgi:hypothetical protein
MSQRIGRSLFRFRTLATALYVAGALMVWSIHVGDQWQHEASTSFKIMLPIAMVGLVESCVRRFHLHT